MPEEIPGYVAGTWDLDPVHSHIGFAARHLMVSKVRGKFDKFDVQIVTAEKPLDSTVTVSIDAGSVDTGNEMRDNDLRSERFLDVANYPLITFKSTSVTPDGDGYKVVGDLTIRGVTKQVTLNVGRAGSARTRTAARVRGSPRPPRSTGPTSGSVSTPRSLAGSW